MNIKLHVSSTSPFIIDIQIVVWFITNYRESCVELLQLNKFC